MALKHMTLFWLAVLFTVAVGCAHREARVSQDELAAAVKKTIKDNPEIIFEVIRENKTSLVSIIDEAVRERKEQEERERMARELKKPHEPELQPDRPRFGAPDPYILIIEYSDFLCSYCRKGSETVKELMELYPEKIGLVFKHYATSDLSKKAAMYFEAIARQSPQEALRFHDMLFEDQEQLEEAKEAFLERTARKVAVDFERLMRDINNNPALAKLIEHDVAEARSLGFRGRPSFLVNGIRLFGAMPLEKFESVIELIEQDDS